jgi:hypothetical protein
MSIQQQAEHEMILENVNSSGVEEWYCPTCGRRFLLQWPPEYKKVILEAGDENAIHSGGKGGFSMSSNQIVPETGEEVTWNDPNLLPWIEWMEQVDFESLWRK